MAGVLLHERPESVLVRLWEHPNESHDGRVAVRLARRLRVGLQTNSEEFGFDVDACSGDGD